MGSFSILTSCCLILSYVQQSHAFWRLACSVSQTSRIDPILSPGSVSGHVHKFAGGNNVNMNSNQASLFSSTCSTCEVQSDKSAYWTPQLYYQHANGTIEEVQNDGMTVYYVGRGGNSSNTVPFPDGFKMISGDSTRRHYDNNTLTYQNTRPIADRQVYDLSMMNTANRAQETHYIDDTNCVNGLRAQINFQSCWDGVNLYKSDQSHVAYLSGIDYGSCPPTHPVPIPGLFFEVLYWSNRIDQSDGGHFVFSNGDATGYGFHGDFMNGWDQDVQAQAVQDCLYVDNDGVVAACAPLAASNDLNFARDCLQSPEVLNEDVTGVLPNNRLPGCNPITFGPADSPQVVCGVNSTTPLSTGSSTTSTTAQSTSKSGGTATSSVKTQSGRQSSSTTSGPVTSSSLNGSPGNFAQGAATTNSSNISSNATATGLTTISGTKVVTIAVPGYTTLAVVLPATLNPQTSFSDIAAASSYISSLASIAMAEASSAVATGIANATNTSVSLATVTLTTISQSVLTVTSNQVSILTTTQLVSVPTSTPTPSIATVTVYPGGFYGTSTLPTSTSSYSSGNGWAKWNPVATNFPNGYYGGPPKRRDVSQMDDSNWGKTMTTKHHWNGTYSRGPYFNGTYSLPPYLNGTNATAPCINVTSSIGWNSTMNWNVSTPTPVSTSTSSSIDCFEAMMPSLRALQNIPPITITETVPGQPIPTTYSISPHWNATNVTTSALPCNTSTTILITTSISTSITTLTPIWTDTSAWSPSATTPLACPSPNSTYTYPPSNSSSIPWPYPSSGTNLADDTTTTPTNTIWTPVTFTPSTFLTQYTVFAAPSLAEWDDMEISTPTRTSTTFTTTATTITTKDYDNDNDKVQYDDNDYDTPQSKRWDIRGKRRN